jgi:hypothetical protein
MDFPILLWRALNSTQNLPISCREEKREAEEVFSWKKQWISGVCNVV